LNVDYRNIAKLASAYAEPQDGLVLLIAILIYASCNRKAESRAKNPFVGAHRTDEKVSQKKFMMALVQMGGHGR
jgi:hypothetical protein